MYIQAILPFSLLEGNKESGLEDLLRSVDALDLLTFFNGEGIIYEDHIKNMDTNDLKNMGISSDRAQQLHRDIEKETNRKKRLYQKLKDVKCDKVYEKLVKTGYTSEEVLSTDHDVLKKIGLSFPERKEVLSKIQAFKDVKAKGIQSNTIHLTDI